MKEFEEQQHVVNNIIWMTDRSGGFITSNEKVGTVLYWNVAVNEPRQINKVGTIGTNSMMLLDNQGGTGARILLCLHNGAMAIYNMKRQSIEF